MRVTVEPKPLIGIVAMLGGGNLRRKNGAGAVRLTASAGRVCVEGKAAAGVTDAAVWEDGQCSVSRSKLLAALEVYRERSSITFRADDFGLRMGDMSVPVSHYHSQAEPPPTFQIFLATTSGTVSSPSAPPPPGAAI